MKSFDDMFSERGFVSEVYRDSLRDNFDLVVPPANQVRFDRLKDDFDNECKRARPRFAELLRVEIALADLLPPEMIQARFWSVADRFKRVVPAATRTSYWESVPQRGDPAWMKSDFVREQTRVLLDVIHANYLVNFAREESIKRLKLFALSLMILILIAAVCLFFMFGSANTTAVTGLGGGYLAIYMMGLLGAIVSSMRRLQLVTTHDAMTLDGMFELIGLRVGWTGMVVSVLLGGVFSLLLYYLIVSGLIAQAIPLGTDDGSLARARIDAITVVETLQSTAEETRKKAVEARAAASQAGATTESKNSATEAEKTAAAAIQNANAAKTALERIAAIESSLLPSRTFSEKACGETTNSNKNSKKLGRCSVGLAFAHSLGLADAPGFYKMLVLAFLAGFAERLVPDILDRLGKKL